MHPDLTVAQGRSYQQELRRQAVEARKANKLQQPAGGNARLALPRIRLGHPVATIRMKIAHA